jgi:predicted TPR repeat methyltransferase
MGKREAAGGHGGHLGAVYGAADRAEVAAAYDAWAATYEAEMRQAGYRHPSIVLALLARHLPPGGPVLDAGAGTGLLGEWLGLVGYAPVEALDLSEGMLAVAAAKGVYARLTRAALGDPLPFADAAFAGIVAAGVFTTGHVGAEALPELARIARPDAPFVATVKTTLWDDGFAAAAAAAGWRLAETTAPYVSMPGEAATVPSRAAVFRRAAAPGA